GSWIRCAWPGLPTWPWQPPRETSDAAAGQLCRWTAGGAGAVRPDDRAGHAAAGQPRTDQRAGADQFRAQRLRYPERCPPAAATRGAGAPATPGGPAAAFRPAPPGREQQAVEYRGAHPADTGYQHSGNALAQWIDRRGGPRGGGARRAA